MCLSYIGFLNNNKESYFNLREPSTTIMDLYNVILDFNNCEDIHQHYGPSYPQNMCYTTYRQLTYTHIILICAIPHIGNLSYTQVHSINRIPLWVMSRIPVELVGS